MEELTAVAVVITSAVSAGVSTVVSREVVALADRTKVRIKSLFRSRGLDVEDLELEDPESAAGLAEKLSTVETLLRSDEPFWELAEQAVRQVQEDLTFQSSTSFERSIQLQMQLLHRRVEDLTAEQTWVISNLEWERRAVISGVPGSGKTLIAAELAIRRSNRGERVLLLCHNPHLALHLSGLVAGSAVLVRDISSWVTGDLIGSRRGWTHFVEPTDDEIVDALGKVDDEVVFDTVVVDEGQDFRADWWVLVESAITRAEHPRLYVFFDDRQALSARYDSLPDVPRRFDLSKNCRNAGQIYRLMRALSPGLPDADAVLQKHGSVLCLRTDEYDLRQCLAYAHGYLAEEQAVETVILTPELVNLEDVDMGEGEFKDASTPWSAVVSLELQELFSRFKGLVDEGHAKSMLVPTLSRSGTPTLDDSRAVDRALVRWRRTLEAKARGRNDVDFLSEATYAIRGAMLVDDVPLEIVPYDTTSPLKSSQVATCSVASYKGLESSSVILLEPKGSRFTDAEFFVGVSRARSHLVLVLTNETFRRHNVVSALGNRDLI